MDSRKEVYHGVEDDEIYLVVVMVDVERDGLAGKARRRVRRKPSCAELRRPICGATSVDSKNGLYFCNSRVEGYAGIYIYAGFVDFGKSRYFSNY